MPGQAVLPGKPHDPTGVDPLERRAIADFNRRLDRVRNLYVSALAGFTVKRVVVNASTYDYLTSPEAVALTMTEVGQQVDQMLLEGGTNSLWFTNLYVERAAEMGAAQQHTNLTVQSTEYAASRPTLTSLISSPAYRTRLGYLKNRVATSLTGFANSVKAEMSTVLQNGLALGKGARDIAADLSERIGISKSKAELIARTEVPGALRAARLGEAEEATKTLGIKSLEMHLSALSPTTRPDHRARHAHLYTVQDERTWQNTSPNFYNCKCSSVTVLVKPDGTPKYPGIVAKAQAMLLKNPPPKS